MAGELQKIYIDGVGDCSMLPDGTVEDSEGGLWYWVDESYANADTGYQWVSEGHWSKYN
jgi:hypothetical protein